MEWRGKIVSDKNILGGKPIVKGTRLSVEFLLGLFANGCLESDVLENYPTLKKEGIQAVFAFVKDGLKEGLLFESSLSV